MGQDGDGYPVRLFKTALGRGDMEGIVKRSPDAGVEQKADDGGQDHRTTVTSEGNQQPEDDGEGGGHAVMPQNGTKTQNDGKCQLVSDGMQPFSAGKDDGQNLTGEKENAGGKSTVLPDECQEIGGCRIQAEIGENGKHKGFWKLPAP